MKKSDLIKLFNSLSEGFSPELVSEVLVPTGNSGQFAARDYTIGAAILAELKNLNVPADRLLSFSSLKEAMKLLHTTTRFRLRMFTPCLAFRWDELTSQEQDVIYNSEDWVFTEKHNGVRVIVVHSHGVTRCFSRNYSVTGLLPEYWGNIHQECASDYSFAFDAEIKYEPTAPLSKVLAKHGITTDSPLEAISSLLQMNSEGAQAIQKSYRAKFGKDLISFRLIAPLHLRSKSYMKLPLREGFADEAGFIEAVCATGINLLPIRKVRGSKEDKLRFLSQIIDEEGGEGCVAHNLNAMYCTTERRDRDCFVKIKRSVGLQASSQGLGDSIDGWVTGFKLGTPGTANENLVSALEFSINVLRSDGSTYVHPVAVTPNLTQEFKQRITVIAPDGTPSLDPSVYGCVGSLTGQTLSYRSHRLTHPKLLQFPRFDKSSLDCTYSEEWLSSQVTPDAIGGAEFSEFDVPAPF